MKKAFIILIAIFFTHLIYGQSLINNNNTNDTFKYPGQIIKKPNPVVLVFVDSKSIKLEKMSINDINPKWIEKVDVIKSDISNQVYGSKNGVIKVFTKKKYKKRVLREIKKKNSV